MIVDGYWRLDLFYSKQRIKFWSLINRVVRSSRNEHRINREILYSAVVIRKIVEDDKDTRAEIRKLKLREPPLETLKLRVPVANYPFIGDEDFVLHKMIPDYYDYKKATEIKLDIDILCNKIIHSYVWSIVYSDISKKIYGVAFASDKEKNKELYLMKVEDWLKAVQFFTDKATV